MTKFDPELQKQVQKLHRLTVYGRWLVVIGSWLLLGPPGIWGLREEFSLWFEYFSWPALRYGLYYNRIAAICLATCIGMTAAVLVWQSRNILIGISDRELYRLEKQVKQIRATGPTHPLWRWVCKS